MKSLQHKFLRLRLLVDKEAKNRHDALEAKHRLDAISRKAHEYHKKETEALREQAKHAASTTLNFGGVIKMGDTMLLVSQNPNIHVEETDLSNDQFQDMLDERHALIAGTTGQTPASSKEESEPNDNEALRYFASLNSKN